MRQEKAIEMKSLKEFKKEPKLELSFKVPEEFLDYDEDDEMALSRATLLRRLAGMGEVSGR